MSFPLRPRAVFLFLPVLFGVLFFAARPAAAGCSSVTIGANIYFYGYYVENRDFDDSSPDALSAYNSYVEVCLSNTYTDNVSTYVEFEAKFDDSANGTAKVKYAYLDLKHFLADDLSVRIGKGKSKFEIKKTHTIPSLARLYDLDMTLLPDYKPLGVEFAYGFSSFKLKGAAWKISENSAPGDNSSDYDEYMLLGTWTHERGKTGGYVVLLKDNRAADAADYNMIGLYTRSDLTDDINVLADLCYQDGDVPSADIGSFRLWTCVEYAFSSSPLKPVVGLDFFYLEGANGDTRAFKLVKPDFARTLIAESGKYCGLLPRDNEGYFSAQLQFGLRNVRDGEFEVGGTLTWFRADGDLPAGRDKGIGWEVDAFAVWNYTEDVSFSAAVACFVPDEDFAGASDPDSLWLAIFATRLDF